MNRRKPKELGMNALYFSVRKKADYSGINAAKDKKGRPILMGRNPKTGECKKVGRVYCWIQSPQHNCSLRLWVKFTEKEFTEAIAAIGGNPKNLFVEGALGLKYEGGWGWFASVQRNLVGK